MTSNKEDQLLVDTIKEITLEGLYEDRIITKELATLLAKQRINEEKELNLINN